MQRRKKIEFSSISRMKLGVIVGNTERLCYRSWNVRFLSPEIL